MHMAGLTAGHHWVLGGCGHGLWLLGDWKVCQAQVLLLSVGHMLS